VVAGENMGHVFGFMVERTCVGLLEMSVLFVSCGPLVRRELEYWEEYCDVECVNGFGR
jgi:hypothetical protein